MKVINLREFSAAHDPTDLCAAARAWHERDVGDAQTINLGGGEWNLFPEVAMERTVYPSNNDAGQVKSALVLQARHNLVIDGQGARLLVRGSPLAGRGRTTVLDAPMLPIIIEGCENITVRNLTIDWSTPATIQGVCSKVDGLSFEVNLQTTQNFSAYHGQLYVEGEGWTWPVRRLLAVDASTGEVQAGTGDNFGVGYDVNWQYELIGPSKVRITGPSGGRPAVGAVVLFWCSNHDTGARRSPAIFVTNSKDVVLENITINFSWGMGVIAQTTENITLRGVVVEPSGTRKFSLACDGSHFVACRGQIKIEECRFQNQFDDAVNIHGLYYQVVRQLGPRALRVRIVHPQHQGVVAFLAGDTISFQPRPYLVPTGQTTVQSLSSPNSETIDLHVSTDLPSSLTAGMMIENFSAYPDVILRGCTIRWNRARGVLLNGRGKFLVENNHFETAGSAILVESSPVWGESGPIGELVVKENEFKGCTHSPMWGKAVIWAVPEFREKASKELPPFHGKLRLQNNTFNDCKAPRLLAETFAEVIND